MSVNSAMHYHQTMPLPLPDLLRCHEGRVAVVVAHPDDESIGIGGLLAELRSPLIVVVSDGAPLDRASWGEAAFACRADYASRRMAELRSALRCGGAAKAEVFTLGFIDQTLIFSLSEMVQKLSDLFALNNVRLVVTHCYEAGHPDHDSVALAVRVAVAQMRISAPRIVEFPCYHASSGGTLVTGCFADGRGDCQTFELEPHRRARKKAMLAAHRSQRATLRSFRATHECFRTVVTQDFTRPPHDGPAYYDRFEWGVKSDGWRLLASEFLKHVCLSQCVS